MNIAEAIKKHTLSFIYIIAGAVTLIAGIILLVWCITGDMPRQLVINRAYLVGAESVRTEYIVGQSFDASGLSLNIGDEDDPEIIPIEDCTVVADFSSAGKRTVSVTYAPDEYTNYTATLTADVIGVRALDIMNYPLTVTVDGDSATPDESFEMYAYLTSAPASSVFGEAEQTELGWKVRATSDMTSYSLTGSGSLDGYYTLTYYCGNASDGFSFYNAAGRSFIVSGTNDIVTFENANDDGASLSLVITERSENYKLGEAGSTAGYYVCTSAGGEQTLLDFDYSLTYTEELLSSSADGLTEAHDGGEYRVTYGGSSFTVDGNTFQSAVVGGMIKEDSGFLVVVDSDERVLTFDYDPVDTTDVTDPGYTGEGSAPSAEAGSRKLTLYVTDYSMNPLLGTGNGWSRGVYIYTNENGESFRVPFYLQAYVWTYVPLSGNSVNYGDVTASDVVFNWEHKDDTGVNAGYNTYFRGVLYSTMTEFTRGEGFVSDRFSAPEERWLGAIMGL